MVRGAITLALAFGTTTQAAVLRSNNFLSTADSEQMQPDLVAKALAKVQDEWKEQATVFTECTMKGESDCNQAHSSFDKSCSTVVSAVVQGSGGDRLVAKEYMATVCSQKQISGWRKLSCNDLSTALIDHAMTADKYTNRERFKSDKLCTSFWTQFVEEERKREEQEAKERADREKREAEARAKAEAEAKKKEEEEAKAEAKRRAEQEKRHIQEEKELKAKKEAEEAKAKAGKAAKLLAEKKAEAEAVAKAAQEKMEEAAMAEKENQQRQAEHQKAEEQLHTAATPTKTMSAKEAPSNASPVKQVTAEAAKAALKEDIKPASKVGAVPAAPAAPAATAATAAKKDSANAAPAVPATPAAKKDPANAAVKADSKATAKADSSTQSASPKTQDTSKKRAAK